MDEKPNNQTKIIERDLDRLALRFDRHLEIYAQNGKELAGVKASVDALSGKINQVGSGEESNTKRISKLEINVAKIAVRSGIYAGLFSAVSSGVVLLMIEKFI